MKPGKFGQKLLSLTIANFTRLVTRLSAGTPDANSIMPFVHVVNEATAAMEVTVTGAGTPDSEITIGETVLTVVASGAAGPQVNAGANADDFAQNIADKVNASEDVVCDDSAVPDLTFTAATPGAAGNDIVAESDDPAFVVTEFLGGVDPVQALKKKTFPTATDAELNQFNDVSAYQETVIAAGALTITKKHSRLEVVGGGAVTLAAPGATMLGQIKVIEMTTDDGDVTMALTNVEGGSAATTCTFNSVDDKIILIGGVSKWTVLKEFGVALT